MSQTGVPDRRLHGIPLLQQHLDERGADVPAASGDAGHLLVAARRHRRSPSSVPPLNPRFLPSLLTSRVRSPAHLNFQEKMQSAVGREGV